MMDGYNAKSCNALEKPFYRPVEAALRWCGLVAHEAQILQAMGGDVIPKTGQFPQWPCLQKNAEIILDAVMNGNIPHGREGKTVAAGDHVTLAKITVRHTDLRKWFQQHRPQGGLPAFLFDEIERNTHKEYTHEAVQKLQLEKDAAKDEARKLRADAEAKGFKIAALEKQIETTGFQIVALEKQITELKINCSSGQHEKPLGPTERNTLLTIIAALCKDDEIDYEARGAANHIVELTDDIGAHVDEGTVKRHIEKIPDALESRKK